jgi:hypothetical protein
MIASYAYGHSIDNSSYNEPGFLVYPGLSKFDCRNIFTYTAIWELPSGAGKPIANSGIAKALLGGWQLNGLWTWESGLPLLFSASSTSLNAPGNSQWQHLVRQVQMSEQEGTGTYWFTPSWFANPAPEPSATLLVTSCTCLAGSPSTARFSADSTSRTLEAEISRRSIQPDEHAGVRSAGHHAGTRRFRSGHHRTHQPGRTDESEPSPARESPGG